MSKLMKNREFWLALALAVLIWGVTLRAPGFGASSNLLDIFNNTSILVILALGQMVVILTRSIDLSMAATLALSGMIVALLNAAYPGIPVPILLAIAAISGAILGAVNGLLVWKLNIPSIVVTLGTLTIYRGTIFLIAGGQWVNADQLSPAFIAGTRLPILGIPLLSWFAVLIVIVFFIMLTRTTIGRALYLSLIHI